jgi:hypothetical protein
MIESDMAKATVTPATNDATLIEEADVPNVAKQPRIRDAGPRSDGKPAGRATRKTVAKGNTGDIAGASKMPGSETKASIVLKKLTAAKGTTIEAIMQATNWQAHSVRGFLSAVVRKKLGHNLISEIGKDGGRRYRIQADGKSG